MSGRLVNFHDRPLSERLSTAADNVECARDHASSGYLAGWEHRVIREAQALAKRTESPPAPPMSDPEIRRAAYLLSDWSNAIRKGVSEGDADAAAAIAETDEMRRLSLKLYALARSMREAAP